VVERAISMIEFGFCSNLEFSNYFFLVCALGTFCFLFFISYTGRRLHLFGAKAGFGKERLGTIGKGMHDGLPMWVSYL